MTILALSESEDVLKSEVDLKVILNTSSSMSTMKALSHLINVTTSELENSNEKLDKSAKKAIELRDFTNKIFDSQSSITITSSKSKKVMVDANAEFFSFFHYKNVAEFIDKH
jgi:hypothetical protein